MRTARTSLLPQSIARNGRHSSARGLPMHQSKLLSAHVLAVLVTAFAGQSAAQDVFADRPAFSRGDHPARSYAQCHEVRAMSDGLADPGFRIDLSATGKLTLVKTDGALWYLVICPDVRIMCVTYEGNDMKVGDVVRMQGAYQRLDANHIVLDPCLAHFGNAPG
jgi:hypothetical protein